MKHGRVLVSRSVSPQPANGEETKDGATTATADSAAAAAQRHVDSAVFGYSATAAHHIAPGAEYVRAWLRYALGTSPCEAELLL